MRATFFFVLLILFACDRSAGIRLGLIEADPKLVLVCQQAISDAKAAQLCDASVEIVNRTGCVVGQEAAGTVNVANMFFRENIQGVIASRCDEESLEVARLAYFWDLPVFTRTGTSVALNDRNFYPTVTQVNDLSTVMLSQAVLSMMRKIGLNDLILCGPFLENVEDLPMSVTIRSYLRAAGVNIHDYVEINEEHWDNTKETIARIRTRTKLIVIDAEFSNLLTVLNTLGVDELGSNGYLILLLCQDTLSVCPPSVLAKFPKANLVVLSLLYENQNARSDQITKWVSGNPYTNVLYAEYLAAYNSCYGFCFGTTLTAPPNGKSFTSALKSKTFEGKLGKVELDEGSNQVQTFVFQRFADNNLSTIVTVRSVATACTNQGCRAASFDPQEFTIWEGVLKTPITPCFYEGNCTSYIPLIIGVAVAILLGLIGGAAYFYRRQQRLDRFRLHWKIQKSQVKVIENKASKSKMMPTGEESKASTLVSKRRAIQQYALIGTSKAEFMVLKQLKKIRWLKPELKYISELKRINHDNLTTFLGLTYNEGDRFYILHNLVERASLDNFITDQDFTMDSTFKSAFLRDIITGLQYLHKSPVGYHGLLSSQNCLIDANWVLKLTNFGIVNFLNSAIEREQLKLMEIISFNSYFTTSPENLQDIAYGRMFPRGSRLGDIYSFGMIIFEVLFRQVIEEVKRKGIKPDVTDALPEEKPLIDVMDQCWTRTPEQRPKLRVLNQVISSTFESSKGNLIDQMIRMNFSYAQHLERVVADRTAEFEVQKQNNARLLRQLLPALIAEKLMAGESVEPRSYDAATVLFCQLVDFGRFLSQTAPHNVIRFLNDVFTRFDEVIGQHDAYKTYMVASGVPQENENRHVFEISEIALQLRDVCAGYEVDHIPDWRVQVRIGYHCGPIAAGVVGVKAPRFCLFGDTVNFASRMQSNSPPNQIQLSEPTAMMLMTVPRYKLVKRGIVRREDSGDVNTYWLNENLNEPPPLPRPELPTLPPLEDLRPQLPIKTSNDASAEDSAGTPPDPVHSEHKEADSSGKETPSHAEILPPAIPNEH
ncbi:Guanylate cyclase [Aphelenchoides fujianensis]|nr:Guanylate cyclase [Aphelenchoides fujianensis]